MTEKILIIFLPLVFLGAFIARNLVVKAKTGQRIKASDLLFDPPLQPLVHGLFSAGQLHIPPAFDILALVPPFGRNTALPVGHARGFASSHFLAVDRCLDRKVQPDRAQLQPPAQRVFGAGCGAGPASQNIRLDMVRRHGRRGTVGGHQRAA